MFNARVGVWAHESSCVYVCVRARVIDFVYFCVRSYFICILTSPVTGCKPVGDANKQTNKQTNIQD